MQLTERQQQFLEDLVTKGSVRTRIDIINGKMTLTLDSMIGSGQLAVEKAMSGIDGAPVFVLHTYAIRSLAQALKAVTVNGTATTFETTDDALKYLEARPTAIIDAMMIAQTDFEKELKALVTPEKISENFPPAPEIGVVSST